MRVSAAVGVELELRRQIARRSRPAATTRLVFFQAQRRMQLQHSANHVGVIAQAGLLEPLLEARIEELVDHRSGALGVLLVELASRPAELLVALERLGPGLLGVGLELRLGFGRRRVGAGLMRGFAGFGSALMLSPLLSLTMGQSRRF